LKRERERKCVCLTERESESQRDIEREREKAREIFRERERDLVLKLDKPHVRELLHHHVVQLLEGMGFGVWDLGVRSKGLGCRVQGSELNPQS
jgi:hypothetical protein